MLLPALEGEAAPIGEVQRIRSANWKFSRISLALQRMNRGTSSIGAA
jgi:hypothetical protein